MANPSWSPCVAMAYIKSMIIYPYPKDVDISPI